MQIRKATAADDDILARHYLALWTTYEKPNEPIRDDAIAVVLAFIRDSRERRSAGIFLAHVGDAVAGSAACQLHRSPYPDVVDPQARRFGYIWSVYVEPAYRRRGIARLLVRHSLDHLRSIGCTKAVLHSSDAAEPLYQQLGFEPALEMRLAL